MKAIFVRDYKNYDLMGGKMGVAVSTALIDKLLAKFGEEQFVAEAEKIIKERDLALFAVMSLETDKQDQMHKALLIYKPKEDSSSGEKHELSKAYEGLVAHLDTMEDM